MSGAWSNDQLNAIYIYSATTGELILAADAQGFYFANSDNGAYFKVDTNAGVGEAVVVILQPPDSTIPGVVFDIPGQIFAREEHFVVGTSTPETLILSPRIAGKAGSTIAAYGQSSDSATDNSVVAFYAAFLFGANGNEIGQGTVDFSPGSFSTAGFTVETIVDAVGPFEGDMVTTRQYEAIFAGTVASTSAADRAGMRIYSSASPSSLAGATLLVDYGQITVSAANIPQPYQMSWSFVGLPGQYIVLAARRAAGAGNLTVVGNFRKLADVFG